MFDFVKANELFNKPLLELLYQAQTVHRQNFDITKMQLCTLLSIQTGGCPEDCAYCAQSKRNKNRPPMERITDLDEIIKTADIVVSAVGKKIVRCKMVKKNSCLIDVGIFKDADGKLTGDVDFDFVSPSCGFISPVPGGVGPMTIASLMFNSSKVY